MTNPAREPNTEPAESVARILQERARALARSVAPPVAQETIDLLVFGTARERLAVETKYVTGVLRLAGLTPLPGADAPVRGLTSWRGEVLTLLDIRTFFGASNKALDDLAHVVVVADGRASYGILADTIHSMVTVPSTDLLPVTTRDSARDSGSRGPGGLEFIRGVTRDAVLVLDIPRLLESL